MKTQNIPIFKMSICNEFLVLCRKKEKKTVKPWLCVVTSAFYNVLGENITWLISYFTSDGFFFFFYFLL